MKQKIELLSPVGNIDSFFAACNGGANAIYMGLENFNARMMAKNFSKDEYIKCILKAHILNIKIYLTLNVLLFDNEMKEALNLILELYSYGIDAVIVQDIGLAKLIHDSLPELALHASTQMSIYCLEQVKFLKSIGFKRVVLSRELTLEEIKYIKDNVDIELEIFVHGALCVSYSGQCLLSALIGQRSANRGNCAQPCRKRYSLISSNQKEIISNKYILSKKDIYGLEYINKLVEIGVDSLKIEGRGKTPEYVFIATSKYRKYLDNVSLKIDDEDKKQLMQIFNRSGLCNGYLDGIKHEESISYNCPKNTGIYLGDVVDQRKEYIKLKLNDDIDMHDGIEIHDDTSDPISTLVTCIKDDNFININKKQGTNKYIWIGDISKKIKFGSKVYKTSSASLNNTAKENTYEINDNIKRVVAVNVYFKLDNKPKYEVNINDKIITVESDILAQKSISKSITKEDIILNLSKNKEMLFKFVINECYIDNNLFIPVSALNSLRNLLNEKLTDVFSVKRQIPNLDNIINSYVMENKKILNEEYNSLYIYDYKEDIDYIKKYNEKFNSTTLDKLYVNISLGFNNIENIKKIVDKYNNLDVYLYIPNIIGNKQDKYIKENVENFIKLGIKGFVIGSFAYLDMLVNLKQQYDIKLIADYSLNVSNSYSAMFLRNIGFDVICLCTPYISEDIKNICNVASIEILCDKITALTSRYCIISSFLRNKKNDICSRPCVNDTYKLVDEKNYTYDIYTDNIDCIMRLVRNIKNVDFDNLSHKNIGIRRTI